MSGADRAKGMKSAYELALERLESHGIEPPREKGLPPELRERVAEIRTRAGAKLAELEILHRDRLEGLSDPAARSEAEKEYVTDRRRIEARRDDEIEALRRRSETG